MGVESSKNQKKKKKKKKTFISMFNISYKTIMYTHVSNSLNNKLKNDCIFFQFLNIIDMMFSWII